MINILKELKELRKENEDLRIHLRDAIRDIREEQEKRSTNSVTIFLKDWGRTTIENANDYSIRDDRVLFYKNEKIVASAKVDMVDLVVINGELEDEF